MSAAARDPSGEPDAAIGSRPEVHLMQALDHDPLFTAAVFTYSVELSGDGFEVEVRIAPLYVHLASGAVRARLYRVAERALTMALGSGPGPVRAIDVTSAGAVRRDGSLVGQVDTQDLPASGSASRAPGS